MSQEGPVFTVEFSTYEKSEAEQAREFLEEFMATGNSSGVLSLSTDTAQAVAAHAREPNEAMAQEAAMTSCAQENGQCACRLEGETPTIGLSELCLTRVRAARATLAAIGPVPQDKNAIIDEVFAAISPTTIRNERIIRGLKSPEKPPAPTPPADDEPLCVICGEPWPCTCGSPHAKPTPPAAERTSDWVLTEEAENCAKGIRALPLTEEETIPAPAVEFINERTSRNLTICVNQLVEIHNMPNGEDRNADFANCIGKLQSIAQHIAGVAK